MKKALTLIKSICKQISKQAILTQKKPISGVVGIKDGMKPEIFVTMDWGGKKLNPKLKIYDKE